jgi:ATP-dependent RNA helicase RhlE
MNFRELGLAEELCLLLEKSGITIPTPVQEKAIAPGLAGRDLIVSAQTGTGKTLAYSLPMVTRLEADSSSTALVLVPTRELATQVHQVLGPLLRTMGLNHPCVIIGGVAMGPQFVALRKNPRVIIATPGRLIDHIQNGKLRLDSVKTLVLDEADRMLDMGFLPQVRNVLKVVGPNRQTMLFTATLPTDLKKMIQDLMKNPEQIFVDPPSSTKASIEQRMLEVNQDQKNNALLDALKDKQETVLVFARTKRRTDKIAQFLTQYGVRNDRIHGDRSQAQRQKAIDSFKAGRINVLVATDIAARGLDIPLVELVVNFDLPETKDDYVHRIGRTGRAGAEGIALSFVANDEHGQWAEINGAQRKPGQPKAAHRRPNGPQKKRHFAPWGKRPNREVARARA